MLKLQMCKLHILLHRTLHLLNTGPQPIKKLPHAKGSGLASHEQILTPRNTLLTD